MKNTHDDEISRILDTVDAVKPDGPVSVQHLVDSIGERSFAPFMLVTALLMVSPASAVPGLSTVGAILIGLIVIQMVAGHKTLWLPDSIAQLTVSGRNLHRATAFLRGPVRFIEPHLHERLVPFATRPGNFVALAVSLGIAVLIPPMELVPMLGSTAAVAIALFAAGIFLRDGLLVLLGYIWTLGGAVVFWWILR